jgi:sugar (pentulose or hexulose) kinase
VLIGLDKGTSVVKAVVFDADGRELSCARRDVPSLHPHPGWHEEDPGGSWRLSCEALREAVAGLAAGTPVAAVGVTGHMGGAWLVDAAGRPVRNAICWPDGRAVDFQDELERDGRLDRVFAISGTSSMPGMSLMALGWLDRHEPEALAAAQALLCAKDFVRLRLTGEIATDPSDLSWMPGDAATRDHSDELLELAGLTAHRRLLPPVRPSGAIVGHVTAEASEATRLPAGTPVVTGLGDGVANAVGTGTLRPGDAVTVMGTSCLNQLVTADVELEPWGLGFGWTMPNETRLRVLANTAGTMSLDWMARTVAPELPPAEWERLAAAEPAGAGGIVFLPYLNAGGVVAPFFDPHMRGCVFGLDAQTSPGRLLRAAFEGLAFATADCYEAMPRDVGRVRLTGGGANSPLLGQLVADVIGRRVEVLEGTESGAAGVAMLGAVATGLGADLDEVAGRWCRVARAYDPTAGEASAVERALDLYRSLRDAVRPLSAKRQRLVEAVAA